MAPQLIYRADGLNLRPSIMPVNPANRQAVPYSRNLTFNDAAAHRAGLRIGPGRSFGTTKLSTQPKATETANSILSASESSECRRWVHSADRSAGATAPSSA